jgi:multidrug efflux pump subunit AcrB
MNGLIRASLKNPYAVTVMSLTIVVLGVLCALRVPVDILPVFKSPAVQTLTFYNGMSAANVSHDITNRMERWTGQANGTARQESRSIVGASIVRNYFQGDVDPNGALTQVNSLALAAIPNLPPGTLPPVVLPFDPTSMTPVGIVALDAQEALDPKNPENDESILYDVGRYQARNMIMGIPGAVAPVVYGGKIRAVMAYLDRIKMQARGMSPLDVMRALDNYNLFLPTGDVKLGSTDYAVDSNSMFEHVEDMGSIPLRNEKGNVAYLREVATFKDASFIQTNVVRVDGRRQVYIPVFRQLGASTLRVISTLRDQLADMQSKLVPSGIDLKLVMDQSIYVKKSIESLIQEGVLGAVLCSAVILVFLGEWRMTLIAILTLPLSVLASVVGLYFTGNTINVMTLAGLSLAIGPMVDSAIICLENTHRHLGMGASAEEAAYLGASEVAVPELVASLCTLLVLSPLALMPGLGQFLFRPMAIAVTFAMVSAYLLSRSFVPSRAARWLKAHGTEHATLGDQSGHTGERFEIEPSQRASRGGRLARAFRRWEGLIEGAVRGYSRLLDRVLTRRRLVVGAALGLLVVTIAVLGLRLRREFFPEVDAGAFEIYVRAPSGLRIEETEKRIAVVENTLKKEIEPHDLELFISELGVTPDWSAAYTANAGPMDAVVRVQLTEHRRHSAQEYVRKLRKTFSGSSWADLEFAFDSGGMIRSAMNEGRSSPINIRVTGKNQRVAHEIATRIRQRVVGIEGVVDSRVIQRLDYPELLIEVDRAKAAFLGLTQEDVMQNIVAATNSSIQFNKRNFWIDPINKNQYYVGVSYPEEDIRSIETLLDIQITSPNQDLPVPLRNLVKVKRENVPTEVTHYTIQPAIDLTMGVEGRDLGHVADDVTRILNEFGKPNGDATWAPFDPSSNAKATLEGAKIVLSGEYERMRNTFNDLGIGLVLATLLIYFLMVALFKSYITPIVILSAVPIGLVGVIILLFATGTAINVQSLLGVIFMVGIIVSNTVLLIDFAQHLRTAEGLSPDAAIRKAASIRVRPVVMTALAAFFALVPMALAIERGSEANAPLGRAVVGGLLAGLVTTLLVVPSLYSLLVRDPAGAAKRPESSQGTGTEPTSDAAWS